MNRTFSQASRPSICFIVPFFDEKKKLAFLRTKKLPAYFEYFLGTFCRNQTVALKIFTNVKTGPYQRYCKDAPVSFHSMSLRSLFRLLQQKLHISGFGYRDFRAYKICDYKPMFGLVFSEYLKGYDYWGYCDIDMVIGNLDKFLAPTNINGADIVSGTQTISGYMTLYKNNDSINNLFRKSSDCLQVINSAQNFIFDEHGNDKIMAMKHVVAQENLEFKRIENFVHNDCGSNNVQRNWKYLWQDGQLLDQLTHQEIGAFHFVSSKRNPKFVIHRFQAGLPFCVCQAGFSSCDEKTLYSK